MRYHRSNQLMSIDDQAVVCSIVIKHLGPVAADENSLAGHADVEKAATRTFVEQITNVRTIRVCIVANTPSEMIEAVTELLAGLLVIDTPYFVSCENLEIGERNVERTEPAVSDIVVTR